MKLYIDGNINRYYVQTLCMIFFPGEKFPEDEEVTENTPVLSVKLVCTEEKAVAEASIRYRGEATATKEYPFHDGVTEERTRKLAVGGAGGSCLCVQDALQEQMYQNQREQPYRLP